MPVVQHQNDSVPNGWMARLEAARVNTASRDETPTAVAKPPPIPAKPAAAQPPPLKPKGPPPRPAHLLVAQLEQEEQRRRAEEQSRLQQLFESEPKSEIAAASLDLPEAPKKKKRVPNSLLFALLAVVVVGGLIAVFMQVQKEPPPKVEIDPALAKQVEDKKKAFEALEQGHTLAQAGKEKAPEALKAYQTALKFAPDLASAERGMAVVYAAQDDDENAVKHYRRYLDLEPKAKDAAEVRKIIKAYERASKKGKRK